MRGLCGCLETWWLGGLSDGWVFCDKKNSREKIYNGMASKGSNSRANIHFIYRFPLPLIFPPPGPSSFFKSSPPLLNPRCEGVWDALTGSVWVNDPESIDILWQRGNFGKGSLSRSEPSWHRRKVKELTGSSNSWSLLFWSKPSHHRLI